MNLWRIFKPAVLCGVKESVISSIHTFENIRTVTHMHHDCVNALNHLSCFGRFSSPCGRAPFCRATVDSKRRRPREIRTVSTLSSCICRPTVINSSETNCVCWPHWNTSIGHPLLRHTRLQGIRFYVFSVVLWLRSRFETALVGTIL